MQFPQINLNGTSGTELVEQYIAAAAMVRAALETVRKMEVHGRDYQTLEAGAFQVAQREHIDRQRKLSSVAAELEALALEVTRQLFERDRG
jgi:purine-nucleoside phosphorylase